MLPYFPQLYKAFRRILATANPHNPHFFQVLEDWMQFCTEAIGSIIITAAPGDIIYTSYYIIDCILSLVCAMGEWNVFLLAVKNPSTAIMYAMALH